MTFLSPLLIWGTVLGLIPIVIHLLNRRRFRRVEWAPMRYLRLTIQRNKRKIQLEELLLLLVRIALPVLLFLMLARPVPAPTGLERWLGRGGGTSQIVVVDDSMSMNYADDDGESVLQRARRAAASLFEAVRPEDRCSILVASAPTVPIILEVEGSRREELISAVEIIAPTATHAAWPTVMEGVDEVLKARALPTARLTILTDLRRSGWDQSLGAIARRWSDEGIEARIIDLGSPETANVALDALIPVDRTILAGTPSHWEAVIRNDSSRTLVDAKAILTVDERPTEVSLPEIQPGETIRVPLTVSFPNAGPHEFSLELPDDALPDDNRRWAAATVKDSLLIRLVDGEPSTEPFGSEVDYLAAPLSIGVGRADAWRVEVVTDQDFVSPRLEPPDVLVLANVAAPSVEQADRLGQLVREGAGLMIFTGGQVDIGLYNDLLAKPGNRLLPFPLKAPAEAEFRGLFIEPVRPSPLEKLLDLKPSALERVVVRRFMTVEETPAPEGSNTQSDDPEPARVLARWNDPNRSPAVAERIVGEGRVLLWTTSADRAENDWPVEPSFVLAVREAVGGTARSTSLSNTITAGDPLRKLIHASGQVDDVRLIPPDGEAVSLAAVPVEGPAVDDSGSTLEIQAADSRAAGVYKLSWNEAPLGPQRDLFAANPDPRESDLERIDPDDLRAMWEPLGVEVVSARDGSDLFAVSNREVWRNLATALLVLLVFESVFATWVGRSR